MVVLFGEGNLEHVVMLRLFRKALVEFLIIVRYIPYI